MKTGSKALFSIKSSANLLITNIFHVSEVQTIVTILLLIKKISFFVSGSSNEQNRVSYVANFFCHDNINKHFYNNQTIFY